eukprot:331693-Pyramimonas_sp.AAC.2
MKLLRAGVQHIRNMHFIEAGVNLQSLHHSVLYELVLLVNSSASLTFDGVDLAGQILAKLNHKNIVSYYGSFVEDYYVNVVMEYADGGTLHSRMAAAKAPFTEDELLNIFTQVC